jgi:hypothetical protein
MIASFIILLLATTWVIKSLWTYQKKCEAQSRADKILFTKKQFIRKCFPNLLLLSPYALSNPLIVEYYFEKAGEEVRRVVVKTIER